jgi:xanthine dehydrogenase iron-sulfur cluster and FAD-binding subunit A
MDIAVVGCAVNVTLDAGGTCTDARVVLGAVAPTQIICAEAAQALIGHKLDDETLQKLDSAGRLPADLRQARHDRVPHQDCRGARAPGGRHRFRARCGARLTEIRETP